MTASITELAATELEVEEEIIEAYATLGRLLATPAINELAERRRQRAIRVQRLEIARMQKVLIDVQLELRAARDRRADG